MELTFELTNSLVTGRATGDIKKMTLGLKPRVGRHP